jgi:hypothetical protein
MRPMKTCSFILVFLVFAALESATEAGTFRIELSDITTDAHPGANYLQANFDFGTSFQSIESVNLELTMPTGYGSAWGGTVESISASFLRVVIHENGFDISPHLPTGQGYQIPPPLILNDIQFAEQEYDQLQPAVRKTVEFTQYAKGCWIGCITDPGQVLEYFWPTFLYMGKGAVTLQGYEYYSGNYLNGIPSSTSYTKPPAVTHAALIFEATPTPETNSVGLLLIGLVVIGSCRMRAKA